MCWCSGQRDEDGWVRVGVDERMELEAEMKAVFLERVRGRLNWSVGLKRDCVGRML